MVAVVLEVPRDHNMTGNVCSFIVPHWRRFDAYAVYRHDTALQVGRFNDMLMMMQQPDRRKFFIFSSKVVADASKVVCHNDMSY